LFDPAARTVRFLNSTIFTFHCTRCTCGWAQACNFIIRGLNYETDISSSHSAAFRHPLGEPRQRSAAAAPTPTDGCSGGATERCASPSAGG
jgi:hypothetical protein